MTDSTRTQGFAVRSAGSPNVLGADSITAFGANGRGSVLVTGSHAGQLVGAWALSVGAVGLIASDAGMGKEAAGVRGLDLLDEFGVPGAAVDVWSARIGDGTDVWDSGELSAVNHCSTRLGIVEGMSARSASLLMANSSPPRRAPIPARVADLVGDADGVVLQDGPVRVVALDSAGWIDERHRGAIVITGSHGGVVAGRAVKEMVSAAAFNDAGIGKERSGVGRLAPLDGMGIPGFTVAHDSARIGDGLDTFDSGRVSCLNEAARRRGVEVGSSARAAVERLQQAISEERG